jgi:hypothetical protein
MNKIIRDAIIEIMPSAGLGIKLCDKYKGELEESGTWNPELPAMFVQMVDFLPKLEFSDSTAGRKEYTFALLVADRYDSSELAEKVFDYFDGLTIVKDSDRWEISPLKVELIGWVKSVEIFKVMIKVF